MAVVKPDGEIAAIEPVFFDAIKISPFDTDFTTMIAGDIPPFSPSEKRGIGQTGRYIDA